MKSALPYTVQDRRDIRGLKQHTTDFHGPRRSQSELQRSLHPHGLRATSAKSRPLDTQLLSDVSDKLARQELQASLKKGNLAQAESHISQVLSLYQGQAWSHQDPLGSSAKKRPKSGHDLYGQVQSFFTLCLQQKRLATALNCARNLPANPSLFTALLKACLDHGDFYAVSQAVQVRKEMGIPEDAFCYTALLKAAARERNASRTESLFEKAWDSGIREAPIFNVLISQHNALGQIKEAFATYDRMLQLGVEPDVVTMNLLIKAAGMSGRLHVVEQLYNQMVNIGPTPTAITFVHLFSAYENSQRKEYSKLLQVFEDMLSLEIQLATQHFVTFLGACCDMPMSAREIRQVFSRAMSFCAAQRGDCSVYAALLKFCVSQGIPEKAIDVWKAIQKAKHRMNSWVYAAMFTACAAYKSPEHCMILTQAFDSLRADYKKAKAARRLSIAELRGQRIAFNALLNACAKTGMMKAAEELLESMQKEGPSPDIISYNTLISGYAQAANTTGAFNAFYGLCEASSQATASSFKLRPDSRTFGAMLHSCARAGNADSAKKVLQLMRHAGLTPTAEAYTSLMNACIKQGSQENIAYAFEVFSLMKSEGVSPSAVTYGCLMNGCGMQGKVEGAMELYEEACTQGIFPSDECHNTLVNMFAKNHRLEEALESLEAWAEQRGRGFQAGMLNSLARALAPEYIDKAIQMVDSLQTDGLVIHRDTYVVLIQACTQESRIDTAHDLYWALSNEGAVASQEAGSRLIMALCLANQTQNALAVYDDMILDSNASISNGRRYSASATSAVLDDHGELAAQSGRPRDVATHSGRTQPFVASTFRTADQIDREISGLSAEMARPSTGNVLESSTMTAADRLGLRRKVIPDDDWDRPAVSSKYRRTTSQRKRRRYKRAVFPHSRAIAALVQVFSNHDLDKAFELYCQLRQDSAGAAAVTLSDRFMWQSLIEAACRKHRVDIALQVYDDWKDYCATQEALHRFDDDIYAHIPRLSNVTLAFLEARCRTEASRASGREAERLNLRVYDVCATLRQQQDRKVQANLPRPPKPSHHFADAFSESGMPTHPPN